MTDFEFIYSDQYLRYVLGEGHPTNPLRAFLTLDLLRQHDVPHVQVEPEQALLSELRLAHTPDHIHHVSLGRDYEWQGYRPWLHSTAALIYGGTLDAARRIAAGQTKRAFNPMGSKHHAMADRTSGFCIYNDIAAAGRYFTSIGMRVLYLDWDIHHGDGVEAILRDDPAAMTSSIHAMQITPNMGHTGLHTGHGGSTVLNRLLRSPDGDALDAWLDDTFEQAAAHAPDVILLAAGADGHWGDRSRLGDYEVADIAHTTERVVAFADAYCEGRVLAGGAGGYSPHRWTPRMWLATCQVLAGVEPTVDYDDKPVHADLPF